MTKSLESGTRRIHWIVSETGDRLMMDGDEIVGLIWNSSDYSPHRWEGGLGFTGANHLGGRHHIGDLKALLEQTYRAQKGIV